MWGLLVILAVIMIDKLHKAIKTINTTVSIQIDNSTKRYLWLVQKEDSEARNKQPFE